MSVSSRFPPEVTAWMERWRLLRDGELLTTHSSWILPVRQGDMPAMLKVARIPDEEAGYLSSEFSSLGSISIDNFIFERNGMTRRRNRSTSILRIYLRKLSSKQQNLC